MRVAFVIALLIGVLPDLVFATSVGPDNYPYMANDQLTYSFEDISGTGTRVLDGTDNTSTTQDIGFTFRLYDANFTTVSWTANGLLTFGSTNTSGNNNSTLIFRSIAVLWDDWHFIPDNDSLGCCADADGTYYELKGTVPERRFIIQWNRAYGVTSSPSSVTFQVILYESSNRIVMQYSDVISGDGRDNGGQATVRTHNIGGAATCFPLVGSCFGSDRCGERLTWSNNSAVITNSLAIQFTTNTPHLEPIAQFGDFDDDGPAFLGDPPSCTGTPTGFDFDETNSTLWYVDGQNGVTCSKGVFNVSLSSPNIIISGFDSTPINLNSDAGNRGIAVDSRTNELLILDDRNGVVTRATKSGQFVSRFSISGEFAIPPLFTLGAIEYDPVNDRIWILGADIQSSTNDFLRLASYNSAGDNLSNVTLPELGEGNGEGFSVQFGLAYNPNNDTFLAAAFHTTFPPLRETMWEFTRAGNLINQWPLADCDAASLDDLAIDHQGRIYFLDITGDENMFVLEPRDPDTTTALRDWGWTHRP